MFNRKIQDRTFDILSEATMLVITDTPTFEHFNMLINSIISHTKLVNITVSNTLQTRFDKIWNWYQNEYEKRVPEREQGDNPHERERLQIKAIYELQLQYKEGILNEFTKIISETGVLTG